MVTLGGTLAIGPAVEIFFLVFFTLEISLRLLVHRLYFFVNEEWAWNIMDLLLLLVAVSDVIMEYLDLNVGRVGVLRLLRIGRLLRVVRVLRFLKEVRVMLVAIVGSFLSLFWALGLLAVIMFIFAVYLMQRMTPYLSSSPRDALWEVQWSYFQNTGRTMYVLLMAGTGGKNWEEVYELIAPLGADCAIAFTFYLLFFMLGVMNIITGVFVENSAVLFKPDDSEVLDESLRQVKEDIEQVTAIITFLADESGQLSVDEFLSAVQQESFEFALRTLGVDLRMPEHYFRTLADVMEKDVFSVEEFVAHIVQMKGSTSRADVQSLLLETAVLQREMRQCDTSLRQILQLLRLADQGGHVEMPGGLVRKKHSSLLDGFIEEFQKHQRELTRRAEAANSGLNGFSINMFNFRKVQLPKFTQKAHLQDLRRGSVSSNGSGMRARGQSWPRKK
ncbi:unnamed protein product [Effrenium voratum]|nr:unnamed protein product [Effrenium voratum]